MANARKEISGAGDVLLFFLNYVCLFLIDDGFTRLVLISATLGMLFYSP